MNLEYSVEEFSERMIPRVQELFASYFPPGNRLLTADYNRWLYLENPLGAAQAVIAQQDGQWVGFMALLPVQLERRGESLPTFFAVNLLVHPEHQGKKIFGSMIGVAGTYARQCNAAMMGHPNAAALKGWQRGGMQFRNALVPSWPLPQLGPAGLQRSSVHRVDGASALWKSLAAQRAAGDKWQVSISPEFFSWRYLIHPTNRYRVDVIQVNGNAVGLQVFKPMKYGLQVMVDSFVLEPHEHEVRKGLPWRTLAMKQQGERGRVDNGFVFLPPKKVIPFFLTCECRDIQTADLTQLGLTASDF